MKRAVIIGATSGIGQEVAKCLLVKGWTIGIAGRREAELVKFKNENEGNISYLPFDITSADANIRLERLIGLTGGMDLFFHASGTGRQNPDLSEDIEVLTAETNVTGFIRMVTYAFRYFAKQGHGHIAVISSIAGTRGLGAAPAYSATKRFQNTYIDALKQLSTIKKYNIRFTDIRPGFVDTAILDKNHNYPMKMKADVVARDIVKALERGRRVVVIDWRYSILVFLWRMIPQRLWEKLKFKN
jgi:short-subunit dehydrogenase